MAEEIDEVATRLGEALIEGIFEGHTEEQILSSLQSGAPIWYQSLAEGISPLHAAVYVQNENLVKLLLDNGAVWNAVDYLKITAGDIALSFNNSSIYRLIRDAGIRSELLLGALKTRPSASLILQSNDSSATGSSNAFLESTLRYTTDQRGQDICSVEVDGEEIGVMMGWEEGIMRETARKMYEGHPKGNQLRVLNVGFGLGIIDRFFQGFDHGPAEHVIIEAHSDVLAFMKKTGWYEKPRVRILEGRWQDFVKELETLGKFDLVYTDTFSERYTDLQQFFEWLPDLLADADSRFSFFNGLGATNAFFYDVYTQISDLHLSNLGFNVMWSDVDVGSEEEDEGMTIYSLYVYDRHCTCVYYQDWHRTKRPRPAVEGGLLPAVSQAVFTTSSSSNDGLTNLSSGFSGTRQTLTSNTGVVVAVGESGSRLPGSSQPPTLAGPSTTALSFDEEAKLVYGVVISLRNMVKKLSLR
ncbi:hypothetical protein CVT26_011622 [Gymnopilus dilepis]|uniref:RMT2 domain-containing protein n=1 Tax=Gymnopilus dilepis TaxID=231916 RepID=A0A409VXS7_9AGAR|nr:hypothetical protein CVT26_011622 [Gymnopilus dilepis]